MCHHPRGQGRDLLRQMIGNKRGEKIFRDFCVILSCAFTFISLIGILGKFASRGEQIPLPPLKDHMDTIDDVRIMIVSGSRYPAFGPEPRNPVFSPQKPDKLLPPAAKVNPINTDNYRNHDISSSSDNPHKGLPVMDLSDARAIGENVLTVLTEPSWAGLVSFAAVIATTGLSGFIVMFVDLSSPALIGLSFVGLAAASLSVKTISLRHARGAWFPPGILRETGETLPLPDQAPDNRLMKESFGHPEVSDLPEEASLATLEQYWVVEPYSYVKIERVGSEGFSYIVVEPIISQKEKAILMETYTHLRDIIIYDNTEKGRDDRIDPVAVTRIIRQFDPDITDERVAVLNYYIKRDLSGYGPLEVLMRDATLEDISCNGQNLPVFIFHRTYGSLPTNIIFNEGELNQFVLKLAQKANKQMSLSNPMVDATLPNGSRVQITYSDVVSTKGSSFTIRKFRAEPMTPLDLIRFGTYDAQTLAFLWLAVEYRKSMLIVGGTASGKTSMMNAVSLFIPQNSKVVSLEDTREIAGASPELASNPDPGTQYRRD